MKFVVTAGPTRESLDPVRFLSNPSTGKMGFAVARVAALRAFDREMIERNLSPGGAADILALGFLLNAWRVLSRDLWEVPV